MRRLASSTKQTEGSALVEFAIALPLLVVFIVGIYDFSGAFNQKQKIEQAAQEGAIVAGAQPMNDIEPANGNPDSLQAGGDGDLSILSQETTSCRRRGRGKL